MENLTEWHGVKVLVDGSLPPETAFMVASSSHSKHGGPSVVRVIQIKTAYSSRNTVPFLSMTELARGREIGQFVGTDEQLYLVGGTQQELRHIARERDIYPKNIRLVNKWQDILGFNGGKIIFGVTSYCEDLGDVLLYAKTHGIEVP